MNDRDVKGLKNIKRIREINRDRYMCELVLAFAITLPLRGGAGVLKCGRCHINSSHNIFIKDIYIYKGFDQKCPLISHQRYKFYVIPF